MVFLHADTNFDDIFAYEYVDFIEECTIAPG